MQDFAAIDFETANNERSSVCSVGVVIVRGGEIIEKQVIESVCLHSEYRLTALGRTLIPLIEQMRAWGNGFRPRLLEILAAKQATLAEKS